SDPHEVVKSGQVVKVKVVDVDVERQRIGLTLRLNDTPQREQGKRPDRGGQGGQGGQNRRDGGGNQGRGGDRRNQNRGNNSGRRESNQPMGSMAEALRNAGFGK
ncbi:S1 RNA-binding domain-containing protein, partial [Streptomyces lonegramiae]